MKVSTKLTCVAGGRIETIKPMPLYTPMLSNLNVNLYKLSPVFKWIVDPEPYRQLCRSVRVCDRPTHCTDQEISSVEWSEMIRLGYVKASTKRPKSYVRLWGVDESKKGRRRLIVHPKLINEKLQGNPETACRFPSLQRVHQLIFSYQHVIEVDMRCYFYQFELHDDVQAYFGVRREGRDFVFCRLPMGFSMAPRIANTMSEILAQNAWGGEDIVYVIQIDNIYGFTNAPPEPLLKKFLTVAHAANAQLSKANCWGEKGDILGCRVDMKEKTIGPKMEFIEEHSPLLKKARSNAVGTIREWWTTAAILIWCLCATVGIWASILKSFT